MWLTLTATAFACTVDYESRVIGTHPTDDLVVIRVEAKELAAPQIAVVLYDAAKGTERQRFPILDVDDDGDADLRARRWKAAETTLTGLGVVFDPDADPLPFGAEGGVPKPMTLHGTRLAFAMGREGEGDDESRFLSLTTTRGDAPAASRELARWTGWSVNDYHYVKSFWPLPEHRLAIIEGSACREPDVHFVALSPSP